MKQLFLHSLSFSLLGSLLGTSLAHAGSGLVREQFESARATGMGGAFSAIADDGNCIFYNPAGLARVKGVHWSLIDVGLVVDGMDTLVRLKNFVFKSDAANLLRQDMEYFGFNFRTQFTTKYFSFGVYSNTRSFFDLQTFSFLGFSIPDVDVYAFNDVGAIAGIALPIGPYCSLGVSTRVVVRTGIDAHISAIDLLASLGLSSTDFTSAAYTELSKLMGNGYGIGVNLGSLVRIPLGGKDTPELAISATVEDVGNTAFTPIATPSGPPTIPMTFHGGIALIYPVGRETKLNVSAEARHIFENLPLVKQSHIGTELRHKAFSLRAGLYQGYVTYGASFELLPHTKIHASSYAVELGNSWHERSQRWYMLQASIGFNPF